VANNSQHLACTDDQSCGTAGGGGGVRVNITEGGCYTIRMGGWSSLGATSDAGQNISGLDIGVVCNPIFSSVPPGPAPAPNDRKKNRYISFDPLNDGQNVAFRVVKNAFPANQGFCTSSGNPCTGTGGQGNCAPGQVCLAPHLISPGGGTCWVGAPQLLTAGGSDLYWSKCSATPVFRVWTEPRVDLGDCQIIPVASYNVFTNSGTVMAPVENPTPFVVSTIDMPTLNTKLWGDIVGPVSMGAWGVPDRFVSAQDVLALQNFLNAAAPTKPLYPAANLIAISASDPCMNTQVGTADVLAVVQAAQGASYGPPSTTRTTNPATCTPCP
jgi:hypothetical protein